MKQILIPIDFSENARKATVMAKQMADKTGASLTFLYAYVPYIGDLTTPASIPRMPTYQEEQAEARRSLSEYVTEALSEGFKAESVWATDGIYSSILRVAEEINADLIVVGRTGSGGFLDKLIGSSATRIALDAPCPVLVVPMEVSPQEVKKIVYATQLDPSELDIATAVGSLSKSLEAELSLIKIGGHGHDEPQEQVQIAQWAAAIDIPKEQVVVQSGNGEGVEKGIDHYCKDSGADLLVVSTRKRDFLEQLLYNPSLTKKLVVHTHIPLLVYHVAP
ncbi:nucleotide-binding universal stress UspA family protein [Dyadobacter jejuensis]|uniref:Nucleotide-binding universal stress UspA family protein n=1 Tax=Dyadobacter jejuensis TaxID=1082580 RepID=A0A316AGA1_9BACT|nr:universal stress protein [Dyadobacter jejuensis]PWJ55944.1 nucleotide-binding universal stress UspA family protein [Dyadobacter jejuensis]